MTDICHGKPIAYLGHKVSCPKCKGTFPIIEGVMTTTFYGKGVAIAGMKTSCGATLVATQFTDIVEIGGGSSAGAAAAKFAATAAAAAAVAVAASAATKQGDKEKKITAISWSYGADETPVSGFSRFYVDLNLHVKTENYAPGEMVAISIQDDAGADVLEGVKKITLNAKVGADDSAKLLNVFAGKTLITVPEQATA